MAGPSIYLPPVEPPPKGSRLAHWVLRQLGWSVHFQGLPARQGVIVVYPHTSNWDFPVLLLAKWALGLQVKFWGKDSLFRIPVFGRWLRWLGGVPVIRSASQGVVGQMVHAMQAARSREAPFWLALSPEGTRRRTDGWRSGFYQVALKAGVPLGLACLDARNKKITLQQFLRLSGDTTQDLSFIAQALESAHGIRPAQASPIQLLLK